MSQDSDSSLLFSDDLTDEELEQMLSELVAEDDDEDRILGDDDVIFIDNDSLDNDSLDNNSLEDSSLDNDSLKSDFDFGLEIESDEKNQAEIKTVDMETDRTKTDKLKTDNIVTDTRDDLNEQHSAIDSNMDEIDTESDNIENFDFEIDDTSIMSNNSNEVDPDSVIQNVSKDNLSDTTLDTPHDDLETDSSLDDRSLDDSIESNSTDDALDNNTLDKALEKKFLDNIVIKDNSVSNDASTPDTSTVIEDSLDKSIIPDIKSNSSDTEVNDDNVLANTESISDSKSVSNEVSQNKTSEIVIKHKLNIKPEPEFTESSEDEINGEPQTLSETELTSKPKLTSGIELMPKVESNLDSMVNTQPKKQIDGHDIEQEQTEQEQETNSESESEIIEPLMPVIEKASIDKQQYMPLSEDISHLMVQSSSLTAPSLGTPLSTNLSTNEVSEIDVDGLGHIKNQTRLLKSYLSDIEAPFLAANQVSSQLIREVRQLQNEQHGQYTDTHAQTHELRTKLINARKQFIELLSVVDLVEESLESEYSEQTHRSD